MSEHEQLASSAASEMMRSGEAVNIPEPYTGALAYRPLEDGRCLVVYRMLPGQLRLCVGPDNALGYDDFWCFHGTAALEVAASWDGAGECPGPWHRHGATARRRELDEHGNVIREWVAA